MTNWNAGDRVEGRYDVHLVMPGGMGIVYVIFDRHRGEVFAAKTVRDEVITENPQSLERFQREALMWIKLDRHVNVAAALEVHWFDKKPFLFLEYVAGGDLQAWIGTPRLTGNLGQVVNFAIQFCDGMTHALTKGLVAHRDVKPSNCLITEDGTLKVTDFGLAKAFDGTGQGSEAWLHSDVVGGQGRKWKLELDATHTGVARGTPPYMAPEQFIDLKRVDVRADIYSFGVMLFAMCTGSLPFVAATWSELALLDPDRFRQGSRLAAGYGSARILG